MRARVVAVTRPKSYQVELEDSQVWRRHIDQLRNRLRDSELRNQSGQEAQADLRLDP